MSFNYFLTFRLNDQKLQRELRKVHVEFVREDESIKNFIEPAEKAHITLNVIHCDNSRLEELKNLIREEIENHRDILQNIPEIEVKGLGMFGTSVLWAEPTKGVEYLQQVNQIFKNMLLKNGFKTKTSSYNPHVTLFLAKSGASLNVDQKDLEKFQDTVFGTHIVEEIQLCAMESHQKPLTYDGFWQCEDKFPI